MIVSRFLKFKAFDAFLEELKDVFLKHTDENLLLECAKTLFHLAGKPIEKDSSPNSSCDPEDHSQGSLSDQITSAVATKINGLFAEILTEQILANYSILHNPKTRKDIADSDTIMSLRNGLSRLCVLWNQSERDDIARLLSDSMSCDSISSFRELMDGIVDLGLSKLSQIEEESDPMVFAASFMVNSAIEVMSLDSLTTLKKLYKEHKDDTTPVPARNDFSVKQALERAGRLVDICEAILTGDDSDDIMLTIGFKMSSLKFVATLYLFMNGEMSRVLPSRRAAPEMVQLKASEVLERGLISLSIMDMNAEPLENDKGPSRNTITKELGSHLCQEMFVIVTDLAKLVLHGVFEPKHVAALFKYFGLAEELGNESVGNSLQTAPVMYMFGDAWNTLATTVGKAVLGNHLATSLKMLRVDDRNYLTRLEDLVEKTVAFMFGGIEQALDLYFSGLIASLDPAQDLAKFVIAQMKMWPGIFFSKKSDGFMVLQSVLVQCFRRACDGLLERMVTFQKSDANANRRYSVISDLTMRSDSGMMVNATCKLSTMTDVNATWKIWGAVGGMIQQLLDELKDSPEVHPFEDL